MNELTLNDFEEKQLKKDIGKLTKQGKIEIDCYIRSKDYNIGADTTYGEWNGYQEYWCSIDEISKYNIKRYDAYGDIQEGDIVLNLPYDTELNKEADKYKIKYNDQIYTSKTNLVELKFHYVLVGEL